MWRRDPLSRETWLCGQQQQQRDATIEEITLQKQQ